MPQITQELEDRRKNSRYGLRFSVRFSWRGLPGVWLYGQGITRDMSITGVYVYTQTCPPVQAVLRTEILLPGIWDRKDIRAECEMKVHRVEQDLRGPRRFGFAGKMARLTLHGVMRPVSPPILNGPLIQKMQTP